MTRALLELASPEESTYAPRDGSHHVPTLLALLPPFLTYLGLQSVYLTMSNSDPGTYYGSARCRGPIRREDQRLYWSHVEV